MDHLVLDRSPTLFADTPNREAPVCLPVPPPPSSPPSRRGSVSTSCVSVSLMCERAASLRGFRLFAWLTGCRCCSSVSDRQTDRQNPGFTFLHSHFFLRPSDSCQQAGASEAGPELHLHRPAVTHSRALTLALGLARQPQGWPCSDPPPPSLALHTCPPGSPPPRGGGPWKADRPCYPAAPDTLASHACVALVQGRRLNNKLARRRCETPAGFQETRLNVGWKTFFIRTGTPLMRPNLHFFSSFFLR